MTSKLDQAVLAITDAVVAAKEESAKAKKLAENPNVTASLDEEGRLKPFNTDALSRIISISLTDKSGFEADELTVSLSDHDGKLALPPKSAEITIALGYIETGIVDKGSYKIPATAVTNMHSDTAIPKATTPSAPTTSTNRQVKSTKSSLPKTTTTPSKKPLPPPKNTRPSAKTAKPTKPPPKK